MRERPLHGARTGGLPLKVVPLDVASFAGGYAGAHIAVRGGDRRVRYAVLIAISVIDLAAKN